MCMEFSPENSNVYEALVGSGQCVWSFAAHHCPAPVSDWSHFCNRTWRIKARRFDQVCWKPIASPHAGNSVVNAGLKPLALVSQSRSSSQYNFGVNKSQLAPKCMDFSLRLQEDFWFGKSDWSNRNRYAWQHQRLRRNFDTKARTHPIELKRLAAWSP